MLGLEISTECVSKAGCPTALKVEALGHGTGAAIDRSIGAICLPRAFQY